MRVKNAVNFSHLMSSENLVSAGNKETYEIEISVNSKYTILRKRGTDSLYYLTYYCLIHYPLSSTVFFSFRNSSNLSETFR